MKSPIVRLVDVIEILKKYPKTWVNIEVKDVRKEIWPVLFAFLEEQGFWNVSFSSFHHYHAEEMRKVAISRKVGPFKFGFL